jgi:hypothetical protein
MRFERTLPRGGVAPVAAMGNMLLLLVFLLGALPLLSAAGGEEAHRLVIRVDGRGEVRVDGRPVAAGDLPLAVAQKAKRDPSVRVEVVLAIGLPVADLRQILEPLRAIPSIEIVFAPVAGRDSAGPFATPGPGGS